MNDFSKIRDDLEEIKKKVWHIGQASGGIDPQTLSNAVSSEVSSQLAPAITNLQTTLSSQVTNDVSSEVSSAISTLQTSLQQTIASDVADAQAALEASLSSQISTLQTNLNTSVDNKIVDAKVEINQSISSQLSNLSNTLNGNISSAVSTLGQTLNGTISSSVSSLQSQIDDLEDRVDTLESSSGGSGGGSTQTWTTLYDRDSADPNINLGLTSGVRSSTGVFSSLPDLSGYTHIRLKYHGLDNASYFVFDISAEDTINIRFVQSNAGGSSVYFAAYIVSVNSTTGKKELTVGNTQKWQYASSKVTCTSMRTDLTQGLLLRVDAK